MTPSIPTHRPLVTPTRLAVSIAVAASASSLYLAFGSAWAGTDPLAGRVSAMAVCPAAQDAAVHTGVQASAMLLGHAAQ